MDIQRFNEPTIIKQLEQELENRNAIEKTSMTVDELRMLRNEHQHRLNILLHEITEDIKTKTGLEPKELRKFIADSEIEAISKIEILSLTDTELVLMVDSVINQSVNALVNTANALNSLFVNQNK